MAYEPKTWELSELRNKRPDAVDPQTNGSIWRVFSIADTDAISVSYGNVLKGNRTGAHTHPDAHHYTAVLAGRAHVWMEGTMVNLVPGDVINIPIGVLHDFGSGKDEDCWVVDLTSPPWDPAKMQFDPSREEEIKAAFDAIYGSK